MKIQESAQDYLEAILILSQEKEYVRAADICTYFGYARATVSVYLKQLKENNYIVVDDKNHITLTDAGKEIADDMYDRHTWLTKIFQEIGVPEEVAKEDACRVEHYISATTFRALKAHFENCNK
ncbi:MAG: metal-dependent transcriptional regulator [Lachnospiraceae bacterium]|nr:metal-dependent transcriptional regulator [Lachnospiraceae bacterium]